MPLSLSTRRIAIGKLSIRNTKNVPADTGNFLLSDLIDALNDRITRHDAFRSYGKDSRLMWCNKLNNDENYHHLLFEIGNQDVTGVSYISFNTKATRNIDKRDDEGSHYASHILIKRANDNFSRHLILIESVPGISLSSVKDHLNWICRNQRYEREANYDGNSRKYRPIFEIIGFQSKTIRQALETGILQDVQLIGLSENHVDGLDEDPIIENVFSDVRVTVDKRVEGGAARGLFQRIQRIIDSFFPNGGDDVQLFVKIKTEDGQEKRAAVDHNDDILDQVFVQTEMVSGFDPPLTQRHEEIRPDMIQKMVDLADRIGG